MHGEKCSPRGRGVLHGDRLSGVVGAAGRRMVPAAMGTGQAIRNFPSVLRSVTYCSVVDESTPEAVTEPEAKPAGKKTAREFINELKEESDALRRFNEYLLSKEQPNKVVAAATAPTPVVIDAKPTLEGCGFDTAKYEES